jgi:hypothetical protein
MPQCTPTQHNKKKRKNCLTMTYLTFLHVINTFLHHNILLVLLSRHFIIYLIFSGMYGRLFLVFKTTLKVNRIWAEGMAQMAEQLPTEYKSLSSNPSTAQKNEHNFICLKKKSPFISSSKGSKRGNSR